MSQNTKTRSVAARNAEMQNFEMSKMRKTQYLAGVSENLENKNSWGGGGGGGAPIFFGPKVRQI